MPVTEALAVSVQAGVPVLLWGSPGTGKTSVVRALGEALGWPTEVVIGSIREPADFAGLPVVIDGCVQMAPPLWARRLAAAGYGLLFLDELTTAPPAVQAAMLRVVLERVVGDLALPEGVRVVAAANPRKRPPTGGNSRRLSPIASSISTGRSTRSRCPVGSRWGSTPRPGWRAASRATLSPSPPAPRWERSLA